MTSSPNGQPVGVPVYSFESSWGREVAKITERPEFQEASIRILDPSAIDPDDYNVDSGEWDGGDPDADEVYSGPARVIGIRSGSSNLGSNQGNAATISAIRFQLPFADAVRVRKGFKVFVDEAPNPILSEYVFTVTSDIQGSTPGARTIHAALDGDSAVEL